MPKQKIKFLCIKIAEPYPLFGYEPRPNDGNSGPFYAAGAEFINWVDSEKNRVWCQQMIDSLTKRGWTATLERR